MKKIKREELLVLWDLAEGPAEDWVLIGSVFKLTDEPGKPRLKMEIRVPKDMTVGQPITTLIALVEERAELDFQEINGEGPFEGVHVDAEVMEMRRKLELL